MGNAKAGVYIWSPVDVLIGGTTPGAGNVISNNGGDGINTFTTDQTLTIEGNEIGTDVTGLQPMGNGGSGINATIANVSIGGTAAGAGNIIANNGVLSWHQPGGHPGHRIARLGLRELDLRQRAEGDRPERRPG